MVENINLYELIDDEPTYDGYQRVLNFNGDKENIIDEHGKLLSQTWFDDVPEFAFDEHNQAIVLLDEKYNIINKDGSLVFEDWKSDIYAYDKEENPFSFNTGNSYIEIDGVEYLWGESGELIKE